MDIIIETIKLEEKHVCLMLPKELPLVDIQQNLRMSDLTGVHCNALNCFSFTLRCKAIVPDFIDTFTKEARCVIGDIHDDTTSIILFIILFNVCYSKTPGIPQNY